MQQRVAQAKQRGCVYGGARGAKLASSCPRHGALDERERVQGGVCALLLAEGVALMGGEQRKRLPLSFVPLQGGEETQ